MEGQNQKSWFKKHPILSTIGGIFAFFIIVGILAPEVPQNQSANLADHATETASPEPVASSTPSATPKISQTPEPIGTPVPQSYDSGDYYINSQGNKVQSPTYYDSRPAGATAQCKDGTYSFSQSRRGTCSGHGGVAQWY